VIFSLSDSHPYLILFLPSLNSSHSFKSPIILNSDGTTRRISNWESLSDHEKEVTWRRIKKRNEERRNVLLDQQKKAEAQNIEDESKSKESTDL
ncbi:MAG: putative Fe-S protein YdhL (DUF1289 family), partial [Bacillariaceae sp.]|jgi:predicted Fe-S protein YdhL (DUF1289 family)